MTKGVGRGVSAACHTPVPPSPSEAPILTQSSAGIWAGVCVGGGGVTGWALTAWGLRGGGSLHGGLGVKGDPAPPPTPRAS